MHPYLPTIWNLILWHRFILIKIVYSILDVYAHTFLFFSLIMIHVEDFVLQSDKNVRPKKARCRKFPRKGWQTTQITSPAFASKILLIWSRQILVGTLQIMLFMSLSFPHTMLHCYCTALASAVQIKFALLWWECVVCSHVWIFFPWLSPSSFFTLWRLCFCFLLVCSYTLLFSTFFH